MIFQKINSISILLASIVTLLTFGLCSAAHIEVTKIPSHIKSCDTEKDDVNQCMASAIKIMLSQAGNGIPEINVPPLEPYEIKKASYLFFNNLLKGKIQIKNVKAFGVTAADIQKVQFNQNKTDMNFSMKVFIPKLQIGGLYRAQVNVNNFTLSAKGDFNVTLDKNFSFCRQEDKKIEQCLMNAIQSIFLRLPNGIPELNIPPLEPIISVKDVNHSVTNMLAKGQIFLERATIRGLNAMTMQNVTMLQDGEKYEIKIHFEIPEIQTDGLYQAEGRYRRSKKNKKIEEFEAAGEFNITLTNIQINATLFAEAYDNGDLKYLNFYDVDLDMILGNMLFNATGLDDTVLNFINNFWQFGYKLILENLSPIWRPKALEFYNQIAARMPLHLFMPRNPDEIRTTRYLNTVDYMK